MKEAALPQGCRVYAIGDIHGCLDLFELLLRLIEDDNRSRPPMTTVLILLGDLIDRGPDSAGVVRRAMQPLGWAETILIKGNHEEALLQTLDGNREMVPIWLKNGGLAALRSWGVAEEIVRDGTIADIIQATRDIISSDERAWLARGRHFLQLGDYYFVHAGIRPGVALEKQDPRDSLWIRDEFLDSRRSHGAVVVHGHSINPEIDERPNRIGIDTGAYVTGKLTALGLECEQRWIVQASDAPRESACDAPGHVLF